MPQNTLDGELLLKLLGAKDYEIAVRDQAIAELTHERDAALRALQAQETPKEGKPGLKVAGGEKD